MSSLESRVNLRIGFWYESNGLKFVLDPARQEAPRPVVREAWRSQAPTYFWISFFSEFIRFSFKVFIQAIILYCFMFELHILYAKFLYEMHIRLVWNQYWSDGTCYLLSGNRTAWSPVLSWYSCELIINMKFEIWGTILIRMSTRLRCSLESPYLVGWAHQWVGSTSELDSQLDINDWVAWWMINMFAD